jgi:hypothetical protein
MSFSICSLSSCATSYCAVPPDDHILLSLRSATSSSFRSSSVYHLHLALVYSRIAVSVRYSENRHGWPMEWLREVRPLWLCL